MVQKGDNMSFYTKATVTDEQRTELHDALSLTGAEISINYLPTGMAVPFAHSHKENEEIYTVIKGRGFLIIDGEQVDLSVGDWVRVAPEAKRQFSASRYSDVRYICIQVKENSLNKYCTDDAIPEK